MTTTTAARPPPSPAEQRRRRGWIRLLALTALPLLSACAAEAPPLEALDLRDALTAEPDVLASMPEQARRELAERLDEAQPSSEPAPRIALDVGATTAGNVRTFDDAREARGEDVLVLSALDRGATELAVRALPAAHAGDASAELPPLEGPAERGTTDLEERALDGHAGLVLARVLAAESAHRLVRVTGWPVGVVAVGDVVYVNASWLVAMASLERDPASGRTPRRPPVAHTLSLGGNPYLTYATLEACVADVGQRCTSCLGSGSCDDPPALSDFPSARAECDFFAKDPKHAEQLCALALLSIPALADCVRRSAPTCPLPTAPATSVGLAAADGFLATDGCALALDVCISGGPPDTSGSGGDFTLINVDTSGCQDPFSACASSCKGLGDGCKSGSCSGSNDQSCTSCSKSSGSSSCSNGSGSSSCGSCSKGSSSSGSGSSCGGSGKACKCEQAASPQAPIGSAAWLLAPLGFLFYRARRRG